MRRVVILGCAAGKSTLARHLGDLTGLRVIELDTMFWHPGLAPAEPAGWAARQRELCSRDTWIIDGARMPRA
jgi:adenylate kinase family enzyme